MTILILHVPNLNLLGVKSSTIDDRLTLDKLNRAIRLQVRNENIKLKIIQTHKEYIALNFIQRNRNIAKGLVITPTSWAKFNQTLLETINLSGLPTAVIYYDKSFSFGTEEKNSILLGDNIKSFSGRPLESTISAIDYISKL